MKLQRLELFGFKSFADRTTIEFNAGITAIVGPNGCGKSNISDAIRWVLGEQRPTLIRGTRMDEVIFAGSGERKPINLAEVTLKFANEDGDLPIEYSEIGIGRRVYRDGESEYLLNRRPCRLKDIQDLFHGTGVGAHAYSLIQQGMVDSILSDRTEERRTIFEEAAGVTRYKNRRRSAERKLEATTQDLLRVEDIVREVERTVASLKRQMGKARRLSEYAAEEARLEIHAAVRELIDIEEQAVPLREESRAAEAALAELTAGLGERESNLESLEIDLIELHEVESKVRKEAEDLRHQIARREESRVFNAETIKSTARRLEVLDVEAEQARCRADDLAERRANFEVDHRLARERLARIAEQRAAGREMDATQARHGDVTAERNQLAGEIQALSERLAEVRHARARQASAEEAAAERLLGLDAEMEVRRREAEEAATAVRSAEEALATRAAECDDTAAELDRARTELRAARDRLEDTLSRRSAEQGALQAAAARVEALAALEARYEGYGRGSQTLLAQDASEIGILEALPRAIEAAEPIYEAALDAYLDSLGHALMVRDVATAERGAERVTECGAGGADFVVADLLHPDEDPELPAGAADRVLVRGSEAIRWTVDGVDEAFHPLFSRVLIVADRNASFECRAALAESPEAVRHYVIAGLDGTLIEPWGRWRTSHDADGEGEGLLGRRRRLAEARIERTERERSWAALEEELASDRQAVEKSERAVAECELNTRRGEQERATLREALVLAEAAENQANSRLAELDPRRAEETAARDRAGVAARYISETETEIQADLASRTEAHASLTGILERLEEDRAERLSARHATELEGTEAEADLRTVEREIEHLVQAEEALESSRADRALERERLDAERVRLEAERERAATEIEAMHGELDLVEARERESAERLRAALERRTAWESEIRDLRRRHAETVERRHACALTLQDLEHRRESLRDRLLESYAGEPSDLARDHPLTDEETSLDRGALESRLNEVRRKRANIGPVNMLAVEEYEREAERYEFMVRQRDDLVQAKRQLEEAIRRINATARTLFLDTFEAVRENFGTTFRVLFEGGNAEIRLADPDDPLESAIDIVASPRGKRVQSISLLSGGERALTALSLLFAIYRVKPSPFCILDEVDAPLDDANVSRFLAMIRRFSAETQFIVITHNRRTMDAADYLYGITMEEPGVSTLISVSLEEAAEIAEERSGEEEQVPELLVATA